MGPRTAAGPSSAGETGQPDAEALGDLVTGVEADQERGDRLDDARIRERAAVDPAQPRDEAAELHHAAPRGLGAGDDDVALDRLGERLEAVGRDVLEGRHDLDAL